MSGWIPRSFDDWVDLASTTVVMLLIVMPLLVPIPRKAAEHLLRNVRKERPNECPWCGYDIHQSPGPICSECGRPYDSLPDKTENANADTQSSA